MILFQDMVLIDQIVLQSKIARRAAQRLQSPGNDRVETWSLIQSILVATANVSKIFWPTTKYKGRGERLRQELGVEKNNILSSRKFRNYFEHYDEQVDDWFQSRHGGVYIDLAMNPSLSGVGNGGHRGYNSFDNTLIFRNESLDLGEVLKALEEILNKCQPYTLV
ncbi:hypothetical protein [Pseudochryseolinea flava]|uniref:Uncharacterized protein n=1 Tax=Pseudochryseolinea flava TaxID=2059302 RepID=A0A364Y2U7_9BACT|nr:hypothetical protein [Pseudochryseolinea flava]RAW01100.1 hypothetical protein DQQ10_12795 [Pseudochryseolinea flava]